MDTYDRIRVLWPDHLGLARGKYLPIRYADRGAYHCMALFALGYDREMTPAPGTRMLEGLPDLHATFELDQVRKGWEPNTGVAVADIWFRGEPVEMSSRHALRRAVEAWEELGYRPKIGIELEAYILQPDGAGGWTPWETPGGYVYGTGTAVDPIGLLDEIMREAADADLPIESINSEYDIPQFELTLHYDDAMQACDEAFLFKVLAREVATRHGLMLTFLGKPLGDRGGSGLHVNVSFEDVDGTNALNDGTSEDGLSEARPPRHRRDDGPPPRHDRPARPHRQRLQAPAPRPTLRATGTTGATTTAAPPSGSRPNAVPASASNTAWPTGRPTSTSRRPRSCRPHASASNRASSRRRPRRRTASSRPTRPNTAPTRCASPSTRSRPTPNSSRRSAPALVEHFVAIKRAEWEPVRLGRDRLGTRGVPAVSLTGSGSPVSASPRCPDSVRVPHLGFASLPPRPSPTPEKKT